MLNRGFMTVRIGYHWDTSSINFDTAIPAMRASNASGHLMMIDNGGFFLRAGDLDSIRKVAAALPDCIIMVRLFHRSEGDWQNYPHADVYENHWKWVKSQLGAELCKRLVFDSPFNEPRLAGDNAAAAKPFVDYCVSLVQAAVNAGIKLAIGAFSVGTPHESLLKTVYLPLWRICARYGQGIGLHLYGAAIPEIGELVGIRTVLDPKASRIAMKDAKWPLEHTGWLIARAYRIIKIWEEFQLGTPEHPYPELYIEESLIDNPFNASNSDIKEHWRGFYGIQRYQYDPRGLATWERWIALAFPELSFDRAIAKLVSHARKNIFYHPAFKVVCLFALNAQWDYAYSGHANDGTNKEAGSNFDRPEFDTFRSVLLPAINAENYEDISMPTLYDATISSKSSSNIRILPSATANILRVLTTSPIAAKVAKEVAVVNGQTTIDGYQWLELMIENERGYVAKTQNVIITYAPVDEKTYIVDITGGATKVMRESSLDDLIEYKRLELEGLKIIRNAPRFE